MAGAFRSNAPVETVVIHRGCSCSKKSPVWAPVLPLELDLESGLNVRVHADPKCVLCKGKGVFLDEVEISFDPEIESGCARDIVIDLGYTGHQHKAQIQEFLISLRATIRHDNAPELERLHIFVVEELRRGATEISWN